MTTPDAIAGEYMFQTARVTIPAGKSVALISDDALEVDTLEVYGDLRINGYALRIDAPTLLVGKSGLISGYSKDNVPNQPPGQRAFSVPAAPGKDAPAQGSNNKMYWGKGSAGPGMTGASGKDGDPGTPGNQRPGSLILIAESVKFDGSVVLIGQKGGTGQSGQNGQDGGTGGKGMDAWCDEGSRSAACYSGPFTSGPGGLGGFGGQGGPGGLGGAAAPIVVVTYSNTMPNLENVSSMPGEGGDRGNPGSQGSPGGPGGAGNSCSAKAKWGSFFGACSATGGVATTKTLVDDRERPIYASGDKGITGPAADWNRDPSVEFLLSRGLKPQNGVLPTHIDLNDEVDASRRFALRVELAGRLATTLLRIRDKYVRASADHRQAIEDQFKIELLPVIARVATIIDLSQVISLIDGNSREPLSARIDATIPILRDGFVSEKNGLLGVCNQIRDNIRRNLGDHGSGYFQRVLSWCSATQLSWLPFVAGQQRVVFKTPQPVVGPLFRPYFSIEQTTQGSNSARVDGALVVTDTADHRGDSQMVTEELMKNLQRRLAPSGMYLFSIARSRELLDDMLALDRSTSLIRRLAQ